MPVRIEQYRTYLAMIAISHTGAVLPPVVDLCHDSMVVEPYLFRHHHCLWFSKIRQML